MADQFKSGSVDNLAEQIANIGIQAHGRGSVSWGQSAEITRPTNASMLLFGGRQGYSFMYYVPVNTNECARMYNDALSAISATSTKVTITAVSSGYGSTLSYEYIVFS